ncbi:preprotein translocase subunit SecE [Candidatus Saccharibacteria bacterium]|nr:preprotein translocase subunit SecE [Candidatus Saccharibacteria bacterium]
MAKADKKPRIRQSAPLAPTKAKSPAVSNRRSRSVFGRWLRPLAPLLKVLRWLAPRYFVNAWREVRQVTWPNRRETWRLTLAVFVFATIFGFAIFGVDKVLERIFKETVLK